MNTNSKPRGRPKKRNLLPERPASPLFDEYFNLRTFKTQPMTEAGIERFAEDLLSWAQTEDALILTDFPLGLGICRSVFYGWRDKNDKLKKAIEQAKHMIASRRERGAMSKKYDLKAISMRQYQLDSEWDEAEQRQQKLKMEQLEHQVKQLQVYVDMSRPQVQTSDDFKYEVEGTKE